MLLRDATHGGRFPKLLIISSTLFLIDDTYKMGLFFDELLFWPHFSPKLNGKSFLGR